MKEIVQTTYSWIVLKGRVYKNRLYPIALIICFLVVVVLGAMNIESGNQKETYNETVLKSIAEQAIRQHNDIKAEYIQLQLEYILLEATYETTKLNADSINTLLQNSAISAEQVTVLRKEISRLKGELANHRTALQAVTDDLYTYEHRFLLSQHNKGLLAGKLSEEQLVHQTLLNRIAKVSNRTDITTSSNLTAEKRANFYEMWDLWRDTLE